MYRPNAPLQIKRRFEVECDTFSIRKYYTSWPHRSHRTAGRSKTQIVRNIRHSYIYYILNTKIFKDV